MFKKILIANRGAIAVRIIRTLKKLGCESVVVYAEEDRNSQHVSLADHSYSLGAGNAKETYLNQEKIFAIIEASGAQAIHPGYGFLSENADFSQRCEDQGIIFLGPTAQHMLDFGLKHRARELAKENNVPLLPGTELLTTEQQACDAAIQIGYPVMLKSTAGGGGIGMSRCEDEQQLLAAFKSVKFLGANNFSNDGIFLEKCITNARHIEVQALGDGKGSIITLGDRDCSAQRRNQKVIEECPAPYLSDQIRNELSAVSKKLLGSVNYRSAGTVEFIYDQDSNAFYFLEVNTRLQVEHGVTEQVYGIDIVEWMLKLGAGTLPTIGELEKNLNPKGHSIQVRMYAEDANKDFQPATGLLTQVIFPDNDNHTRIDHWIETGIEISPFFDPMLAKIIATADNREQALQQLNSTLDNIHIAGIETNIDYVKIILQHDIFIQGKITTAYLNTVQYQPYSVDVLFAGTQTSIQDYPGRTGYWHVGIPPSGPFDTVSFQLGNQLLGNEKSAAGLEITLQGPRLKFNQQTRIVLSGAESDATLNNKPVPFWTSINIQPGDILDCGKVIAAGSRSYLLIADGFNCPDYLDSKSTFTLGRFGGHGGRALRTGDVLHFSPIETPVADVGTLNIPSTAQPNMTKDWQLRVIYGPHGAPDFFTQDDIKAFFQANWEVHYNSSRTGIRLIGPKPQWARSDGGEAGMHPSNIHDNAYAIGAIDFTGDMPVILGPDGPSLGGFVCPATVITADLWKLGQLKSGDNIHFIPVTIKHAVTSESQQQAAIKSMDYSTITAGEKAPPTITIDDQSSCLLKTLPAHSDQPQVVYRPQGDHYLLVEYGELTLDIALRFRVHALMLWLEKNNVAGLKELTPGIRSLQIHYNSQQLSLKELLQHLQTAEKLLDNSKNFTIANRIVHIPLSWDDEACQTAIQKYDQSVRKDAPWCPSNIEFIRRINGLESIEHVKKTVFDASYLVMGLGDVYLGAPVATPVDPRHRLVTTKYNPARTWTAENSVGIGGSYLCVYGMEGPGGYQLIGRTLQMWNRYQQTTEFEKPWLLRFFDEIRFYEVSAEELKQIRNDFPHGRYPLKIEESQFDLAAYQKFISDNQTDIDSFVDTREQAFAEELQRWNDSGQINFESEIAPSKNEDDLDIPAGATAIESHVAGSIWKVLVEPEQTVKQGDVLLIVESMKMEIEITAPKNGVIHSVLVTAGKQINAGQVLTIFQ